jgi:hypothetical protein
MTQARIRVIYYPGLQVPNFNVHTYLPKSIKLNFQMLLHLSTMILINGRGFFQ